MKVDGNQTMDRLCHPESIVEMICALFEISVPRLLTLDWLLDAVESEEWGGVWWP